MTVRTDDGEHVRKCITPGCPVHVYPGRFCSDCEQATIPLREWRNARDVAERYEPAMQSYRSSLPEPPPDKAA